MKNEVVFASFTITRVNHNGLMEWYTALGWRSAISMKELSISKLLFNRSEGSLKVKALRADCRIKSLSKSIILNYC